MSVNRVVISGNLTHEPEMRSTADGTPALGFSVAVVDRRMNASGDWVDYPNYVDCTLFGKRGNSILQYLHKGTRVVVDGKLRFSKWESNGTMYRKLEVIVKDIEFSNNGESPEEEKPKPMPLEPYDIPF